MTGVPPGRRRPAAGAVHTSRAGRAVLHTLTPLGRSLLDGQLDPPGRAGAPSAGVVSAS